ncbi:DNA damage-inducible protein D [candidate division SR1 bacterium]|nr:DNA damage-inducible protein D [candidate division SR1 bacterium]
MIPDTQLHHSDSSFLSFEDFRNIDEHGNIYWRASIFLIMIGYSELKEQKKLIDKTIKALLNLEVDLYENIQKTDNEGTVDYKLSRYACYLMAMNGDSKIRQVAQAQNYFAEQTLKIDLLSQDPDRLSIRNEISDGNKSLAKTIARHGVFDYSRFNIAGYEGMYNMTNEELAQRRNINKEKLLDYMGRTELAANLFRVTQTEERIKSQDIKGQADLENAHRQVGKEVRSFVQINTGDTPENLKPEMPLNEMKKELKDAKKALI